MAERQIAPPASEVRNPIMVTTCNDPPILVQTPSALVANNDVSKAPSCSDDGYSTPKKCAPPFCGMTCTPELPVEMVPAVGMEFPDVKSVETFYKDYAHLAGFPVRVGQQKKVNDVVLWKRFYCSREGFRHEKGEEKLDSKSKRT